MSQAIAEATKSELAGVSMAALEQVARLGLSNGAFEDSEEEAPAIVEEFYPEATTNAVSVQSVVPISTKLSNKLAGSAQPAVEAA